MRKINDFGQFLNEGFFNRFKNKKSEFDHRSYDTGYSDLEPNENPEPDLNAAADRIHPINYDIIAIDDELTAEKLEEILDNVLSIEDSDEKIRLITRLKSEHPEIIENPLFRTVYSNSVRKWRNY
jgi:hypothetical protein